MTLSERCAACDSTNAVPFYAGLIRCDSCSHVWADVDLPEAQLHDLYGRQYFHGDEYTNYTADRPELEKNFARRMRVLRRFIDPSRHRRLFEVGCAYGFFLNAVRGEFDSVGGIDVSEDAVRFAAEQLHLPVLHGDLLARDLGTCAFDVACMWDTIEHLKRPDLSVAALGRRMPAGGVLAITTGDMSSVNARIRRGRWRLIHPPTHVHYFTRRSLARMLDRLGFDVVYSEYCGFYRSVGAMIDGVLRLRWGLDAAARRVLGSGLGRWSVYLNLRDIMFVIAVKRAG